MNKENIIQGILNGSEDQADTLMSKDVPYCDIDLKTIAYNQEKAQQLLDEAGWKLGSDGVREKDGQKCEITFSYNSKNAQEGTIATSIQADLAAIGIKMNILGKKNRPFWIVRKPGILICNIRYPGEPLMIPNPMFHPGEFRRTGIIRLRLDWKKSSGWMKPSRRL